MVDTRVNIVRHVSTRFEILREPEKKKSTLAWLYARFCDAPQLVAKQFQVNTDIRRRHTPIARGKRCKKVRRHISTAEQHRPDGTVPGHRREVAQARCLTSVWMKSPEGTLTLVPSAAVVNVIRIDTGSDKNMPAEVADKKHVTKNPSKPSKTSDRRTRFAHRTIGARGSCIGEVFFFFFRVTEK